MRLIWHDEGESFFNSMWGSCRTVWVSEGEDILWGGGFSLIQSTVYSDSLILEVSDEYGEVLSRSEVERLVSALQAWLAHGKETLPEPFDDSRGKGPLPDYGTLLEAVKDAVARNRAEKAVLIRRPAGEFNEAYIDILVVWGRRTDYLTMTRFIEDCGDPEGPVSFYGYDKDVEIEDTRGCIVETVYGERPVCTGPITAEDIAQWVGEVAGQFHLEEAYVTGPFPDGCPGLENYTVVFDTSTFDEEGSRGFADAIRRRYGDRVATGRFRQGDPAMADAKEDGIAAVVRADPEKRCGQEGCHERQGVQRGPGMVPQAQVGSGSERHQALCEVPRHHGGRVQSDTRQVRRPGGPLPPRLLPRVLRLQGRGGVPAQDHREQGRRQSADGSGRGRHRMGPRAGHDRDLHRGRDGRGRTDPQDGDPPGILRLPDLDVP